MVAREASGGPGDVPERSGVCACAELHRSTDGPTVVSARMRSEPGAEAVEKRAAVASQPPAPRCSHDDHEPSIVGHAAGHDSPLEGS